ncbi:DUF2125 domain-containing protein [Epibacterium ulvae]|uniref:DUF2125 domain-containing protein n=1 Tax=Epibacterium ulvae TaxID=1156985 RepID=UPI001BFC33B6|nr:DUF2125 domain-containing protein [Epibacterium ulvae]MBT8154285.1 DUF2125 domain-containing protein [Epibacterium ulvae]
MRRLINWLVVLTLLWTAYWGIAAWALREGVTAWFGERAREGWHAEYDGVETAGYPSRHVTRIVNPALADPGTGTAWSADWISLDSAAVSPTQQGLRFPASPQRFSYFDGTLVLEATDMRAGLGFAPGRALALEHIDLRSGPWQISDADQPLLSGQAFVLRMEESDAPLRYQMHGTIADLVLTGDTRRLLFSTKGLPEAFDALDFRATATFDTPWDRRALEQSRPQPRHIILEQMHVQWGPMQIRAAGELTMDEAGRPTGTITLQAQDWQRMLSLAEEAGVLPPSLRSNVQQVLTLLAGRSGHPERLELRLNFARGRVMLGPLPLGPAPRILLR